MRLPSRPTSVEEIGHRILITRLAMKLTQRDFARRVGFTPQALNNYEKGSRRISIDEALKLCNAVGVTLDWIYRGMQSNMSLDLAIKIQDEQRRKASGCARANVDDDADD